MQTNIRLWPLISKQIKPGFVDLELTDYDQIKLDRNDQVWRHKFQRLDAYRYFRIRCLAENDYILLGQLNGVKKQPGIFYCLDEVTTYSLDVSDSCDLFYSDFIGPQSNGLCVFVGDSSIILGNWTF